MLLHRMTGGAAYATDCTCPPGLTTSVKTGVGGSMRRNPQTCNWYHRPGHFTGTLVRHTIISGHGIIFLEHMQCIWSFGRLEPQRGHD